MAKEVDVVRVLYCNNTHEFSYRGVGRVSRNVFGRVIRV